MKGRSFIAPALEVEHLLAGLALPRLVEDRAKRFDPVRGQTPGVASLLDAGLAGLDRRGVVGMVALHLVLGPHAHRAVARALGQAHEGLGHRASRELVSPRSVGVASVHRAQGGAFRAGLAVIDNEAREHRGEAVRLVTVLREAAIALALDASR